MALNDADRRDAMQLTRMGHSCVRLEKDGRRLVIDPGTLSERAAADGADAILITHEHVDHFDAEVVRGAAAANPDLEIWSNESVAALLADLGPRVHSVQPGRSFEAAGFHVTTNGEWHAQIHADIPRVRNACYLVDDAVFHPGDSVTRPGRRVTTLLLPVHAPWLKLSEAIELAREVRPERVVAIHDGFLNDRGLALIDRLLGSPLLSGGGPTATYLRPDPSATIQL
jgi:L-ascorbate metabolism protein UlaG (beta-lactamase superfamily)